MENSAASEPAQTGPEVSAARLPPEIPGMLNYFASELEAWSLTYSTTDLEYRILESRIRLLLADARAWERLR